MAEIITEIISVSEDYLTVDPKISGWVNPAQYCTIGGRHLAPIADENTPDRFFNELGQLLKLMGTETAAKIYQRSQ